MFSDYVYIIFLVHLLLLLVPTKGSAEAHELKPPALDFNKHTIVQPIVHHGRTKREILSTRHTSGAHHSEVTVRVPIDGQEYVLDLRLNKDLVTDNHVLRYQKNGKIVAHKPTKEDIDLCQYSGTVRDKAGSWVAVSTCHGVRGIVFDGQQLRYIEPAEGSEIQSQHYVYDHSDLNNVNHCGYVGGAIHNASYDPSHIHKDHSELDQQKSRIRRYKRYASDDTQIRGPYTANRRSRYVELVLVVDNGVYKAHGENIQTVYRQMKDIANILNSIYAPLNIFIALVGVEVWTEKDEIVLVEDSSRTLRNFMLYRQSVLVKDIPNDNAHLLTRQEFNSHVIGRAYKGHICYARSGGVATDHSEVIGLVASTIAHEMGHNFGMEHDSDDLCQCPRENCIMNPVSASVTALHWSSCSLDYLALAFEKGIDFCLRNKPKRLFNSPTCGNGFVEPGEQCDCGSSVSGNAYNPCHACCEPSTCMLRGNATCGAGVCCDLQTCRPKSAGTECRSADRECDLPEFCTGHSEYCPDDVFKMDTTPCGKDKETAAYCVKGSCPSRTDQCRLLWGATGDSAHDKCYTEFNVKGTKTGNCGYNRVDKRFMPCPPQDAMCGALHCRHLNVSLQFGVASVSAHQVYEYSNGTSIHCLTAIIDMGLRDIDPGLVPDGAKCGDDMMCLSQRCVPVSAVRERIASAQSSVCPSNCSGHGVCNSAGQCHCEPGFAPPLCALPGPGGSYDSGPATDPTRHFLIGGPLTSLPTPVSYDNPGSQQQIRRHSWQRWPREYVSEMQMRTKWRQNYDSLSVGDLVVIEEDIVPPLSWRLGRLVRLFRDPMAPPV